MVGKINIIGQIGSDAESVGVELVDVISQVKNQPDATSFDVIINSVGGNLQTGFDIQEYLTSLGLPIHTIGREIVASIATVIMMAGQKRSIEPNTRLMIHLPTSGISNATAEQMVEQTERLKKAETRIVNFYSENLGISKEAILPLLKNETFLTEEQMRSLGFVTPIQEMAISAKFINKNEKIMTQKPKGILQRIQALLNTEEIVNKIVFTADQKEINFPDLGEMDDLVAGVKATVDGVAVEGEITLTDGRTLVFVAGELTEIREVATAESEVEDVVEIVSEMVKMFEMFEKDIQAIKNESETLKNEKNEYKAKLDNANAIINKLKGSTSENAVVEPKDNVQNAETLSNIVAKWKTNKLKK